MLWLTIVLMIVIFMVGGFIKGWAGFGTNLLVPPLLMFMDRFDDLKEVMIIVVTVNIFLNIAILVQNKQFNLKLLKNIWLLVLVGVIFNFVGAYLFDLVDDMWFKILLGVMILFVAFNKIFKFNFNIENPKKYFIPTGMISGIINGMFGLGGIPVLILLGSSKMEKQAFKSTLVTYFFVMNLIFIISHGFISRSYTPFVLTNIIYVFVFAVFACVLGVYFSTRASDKVFQRVMNGVLLFFGVNLIYLGIYGEHILFLIPRIYGIIFM